MGVEDYWNDVEIFYVTFSTMEVGRNINKVLIFPVSYSDDDIKKIIWTNFKNVKEVTSLEKWSDALILKQFICF